MLYVTDAEYLDGHKIRLAFSNGDSGVVDLGNDLWGDVFERLQDPKQFRQFVLSETFRTIQWPNGADFAPEFLHDRMVEQAHAADAATPRH